LTRSTALFEICETRPWCERVNPLHSGAAKSVYICQHDELSRDVVWQWTKQVALMLIFSGMIKGEDVTRKKAMKNRDLKRCNYYRNLQICKIP